MRQADGGMVSTSSSPVEGTRRRRVAVLGLPVDVMEMRMAVAAIAGYVEEARAAIRRRDGQPLEYDGSGRTTRQVVTLNPEMAMAACGDSELRNAIQRADLVVADGIGVVWAAALNGARSRTRVTGVDLLDACAGLAAERGYRLFLLGAAEGVAVDAAERLRERHQGLRVVGTFAGSPTPEQQAEICTLIRNAQAEIVFVAYGSPAQECWIARTQGELGAAVAIGVGGAFDFVAGRVRRAPRWMRQVGLEWLYRLWREPWRWRRMLALPRFVLAVVWERLSRAERGHAH